MQFNSCFAEKCRQENIKTDILFQEYHRGNLDKEDVIQIIHKLRDYGLQIAKSEDSGSENKEIQLHVGSGPFLPLLLSTSLSSLEQLK